MDMNFIIPKAFEDLNWEYTGTPEEIKKKIAADLRLYVINFGYKGYTGCLKMAIRKMAKVLTKAEFDILVNLLQSAMMKQLNSRVR